MNTRYRTLIWEQRRVAGVIALMAYFLSLAVQVTFLLLHPSDTVMGKIHAALAYLLGNVNFLERHAADFALNDVKVMCFDTGELFAIIAACALCFRLDAAGNLVFRFERRLLCLPMRTAPLVLTQFWTRVALLIGLRLAQWLTYGVMFGDFAWWWWLLLPVELYVFMQAIIWCADNVQGLSYAILALIFAMFACIRIGRDNFLDRFGGPRGPAPEAVWVHEKVLTLPELITSPLGFAVLLALCTALALWGVSLSRRDERVGVPEPTDLAIRFAERNGAAASAFATRDDALAWYTWRTAAWPMPIVTVAISLLLLLLNLIFLWQMSSLWSALVLGPYLAFGLAALSSNAIAAYSETHAGAFAYRTPASSLELARGRWCAQCKGMAYSLAIAVVWSTVGAWITLKPILQVLGDIASRTAIFSEGQLVLLFLSPVVLAAFFALTAMTDSGGPVSSRLIFAGLALYLCGPFLAMPVVHAIAPGLWRQFEGEAAWSIYLCTLAALHLTVMAGVTVFASRVPHFSGKRLGTILAVWLGATLLLWLSGRDYGYPISGLLVVAAACSLPLLPFLWTPLTIHVARHR